MLLSEDEIRRLQASTRFAEEQRREREARELREQTLERIRTHCFPHLSDEEIILHLFACVNLEHLLPKDEK